MFPTGGIDIPWDKLVENTKGLFGGGPRATPTANVLTDEWGLPVGMDAYAANPWGLGPSWADDGRDPWDNSQWGVAGAGERDPWDNSQWGGQPGQAPRVSGNAIDQWIASTRPNSPLAGLGEYMANYAADRGVNIGTVLGIMLLESQLGADGSYLPSRYNYGGLTGTGWDGQTGSTSGMAREFATFDSPQSGVKAIIDNLADDLYQGRTLQQQIGLWYLGNPNAGLHATDEHQNATMAQYLDRVREAYEGIGLAFDPNAVPGSAGRDWGGGGTAGPGTFPVAGYTGAIRTHHDSGERGSTDIIAPAGTPVYALTSGTVTSAGWNDIGGYYVMIRSDDGTDEYYAHLYQPPLVQAGQRVEGGWHIGGVGETGNAAGTGAHLHLGKGWGIQSGFGPQGGSGIDFDLVSYLQQMQPATGDHSYGDGHNH